MRILFLCLILSACAQYKIETNTPVFLDTVRGYGRIYNLEKINPIECGGRDYKSTYSGKNINISDMNGYVCLPVDQVQYNFRYYDAYLKRKANCN